MSPKQTAFIAEYCVDKNATQAAIRAGYSERTAASQGERLLRNVEVRAAIDANLESINKQAGLESVKVRFEIARLAFSDPRRIMREDGSIKPLHELDDETAAAVASYEVSQDGQIKYKFWDKNSALERACKMLGLFEKDNEQKPEATVFVISQADARL